MRLAYRAVKVFRRLPALAAMRRAPAWGVGGSWLDYALHGVTGWSFQARPACYGMEIETSWCRPG